MTKIPIFSEAQEKENASIRKTIQTIRKAMESSSK
jgi:hypothetical protein